MKKLAVRTVLVAVGALPLALSPMGSLVQAAAWAAPLERTGLAPLAKATGEVVPGRYIVTTRPSARLAGLTDQLGVRALHQYDAALHGFAANLSPVQLDLVRRSADVLAVEPDQVVRVASVQKKAPWDLDRLDQKKLPLNASYTYRTSAAKVTAYIIDTGLAQNSEFGSRAKAAFDATGVGGGVDCHGHGTHVAGTIGASTYGVAKDVQLRGVKVLNCAGSGTNSDVIAGIDWVRKNAQKPAVANMSLGGDRSAAVNTASNNLARSGVFLAVAAGNNNGDACKLSPASASAVTTVGASDRQDNKAGFSNHGRCVHLYAPGVDITSAWLLNLQYKMDGTSMASPHVAGVAALYKATHPNASSRQVRSWLVGQASKGVIKGNAPHTPNRLLNTGGL